MIRSLFLISALGSISAAALPVLGSDAPLAGEKQPVVIELVQSQGCSSCPPALAVLDQEAGRPDVIALNFAVTYWDYLGWKDIYADPRYTNRQWDYARAAGRGNVSTPQLVVAGRQAIVGGRKGEVDSVIAANASRFGPVIRSRASKVAIGDGHVGRPSTVWLVDYDPRRVPVAIRAGENGGRTLPHRNIVKRMTSIGTWNGKLTVYPLPAAIAGTSRVLLVQSGVGGPIVAARKI